MCLAVLFEQLLYPKHKDSLPLHVCVCVCGTCMSHQLCDTRRNDDVGSLLLNRLDECFREEAGVVF